MCHTIAVYAGLSQLRWEWLRQEGGLVEKLPRHGHRRLVGAFSTCSGVAAHHGPPVGVLETHDDGQRDGLVLTGLGGGWGNRNTGDDGLHVVGGVCRGGNIGSYC